MKLSSFAVNKELVVSGVWCNIGGSAQLRVARSNNEKYRSYLRALMKPFQRQIQRNTPESESISRELIIKAVARYILLDWKGIEDDDGQEIPYSEQKAIEILTEYQDFFDLVSELSDDISLFQDNEKEDLVKN